MISSRFSVKGVFAILLYIFSFIFFQIGLSQSAITGKIVDKHKVTVPFAHLNVENTTRGTVSNAQGEFKLLYDSSIEKNVLVISALGYMTKKIPLREGHFTISLVRNPIELKEVTVYNKDYAKELIQLAIQAIPDNYPGVMERHEGFLRELANWEHDENPIYVVEATMESIKKPYVKSYRSGAVKLLELRKYKTLQMDSLLMRFRAGSHHIHRFDVVARREAVLGNPNSFTYKIRDTVLQEGKNVYKIYFEKKNTSSGYIYIQDSSFAIVKIELHKYKFFDPFGHNRQYLRYTVNYEQHKDKRWRFKHSHYETGFKQKGRLLVLTSDYISTEVEPNKTDIPYLQRFDFNDVLTESASPYRPDFWENQTIFMPNKEVESLFRLSYTQPKRKDGGPYQKLFGILSKVRYDLSLKWAPIRLQPYSIDYSNIEVEIQKNELLSTKNLWSVTSSLLYEIMPGLFLGYANDSRIGRSGITSHDLRLLKEFSVNPKGRPIFLGVGVNLGHQDLRTFLGNYDGDASFEVGGKEFDSGDTDIFLNQRSFRWQPHFLVRLELTKRMSVFLAAEYNLRMSNRIGLLFQERKESIFTRKKVFLEDGHENLSIDSQDRLINDSFSINCGLSFRFF